MIASLPMYDRPELAAAHRRFWDLVRRGLHRHGIDAPQALSQRDDLMAVWSDPAMVLAQTCGMPYRKLLHGKVNLVGTPDYRLKGCPEGHYYSVFVVRKDDPRTTLQDYAAATFAFNEENSQSGFAAPLNHGAAAGVTFPKRIQSFGHALSAQMVASGKADIAALDAVTWRLIKRYDAFANDLRVLKITAPTTPVLPFITSTHHNPELVFDAVEQGIDQLSDTDRATLGLFGIVRIPASEYLAVPNP
ncbi:PhnD/SsuA/transferrin family substrate-binding protein [Lentibacter algarum]|uniref:phosphate/phosphite/phosphonate ABC transporter substrate-binding protein n=1 Tax=Lentibacter algarum TaxID=576131 RepID=UPI001C06F849|nr:PhnD/SsuA/transferrin family substrate-binding protein [Lentibacter algarum]MBU2981938.1 PhnD/SsuA/transferrin family substrate-binding protein [Lentibacter algarum]